MASFDFLQDGEGEYWDDSYFLLYSRRKTQEHEDLCREWKKRVDACGIAWIPDPNSQILVMSDKYDLSGAAYPAYGLYGIKEEHLVYDDERIITALAVHERAHLHIGSELRHAFLKRHTAIDTFFHQRLIPDWIAGVYELSGDNRYIQERGWSHLYDSGWIGPHDVTLDGARSVIDAYFMALRKGKMKVIGNSLQVSQPRHVDQNSDDISLEDEYAKNPHELIKRIVTGYQIMEELERAYRLSIGRKHGVDLWIQEEGFVTFVGVSQAGLTPRELERHAHQDHDKIAAAEAFASRGIFHTNAITAVNSYPTLATFVK